MVLLDLLKLVESFEKEIISSTQEIIKIKSIEEESLPGMPFGKGPYKALEYALNLSEDMGFKTKRLDGYAGHADLGEGEEIVGVLVHIDVVPEGSGWTYEPYAAEIHEGKIYGRGTTDDKGPAIAVLYAMKAISESGVHLSRKIRIIFGANEETGWGCMKYYFANEEPPNMAFTPDADFPVIYGEKGIIDFDLAYDIDKIKEDGIELLEVKGGNAPNMVPDYAEVTLKAKDIGKVEADLTNIIKNNDYPISLEIKDNKVKIAAEGKSAHGSTPEKGENAISYLMQLLGKAFEKDSNLGKFIHLYNDKIGFTYYGENIGCGFSDDISGKLNFNPGVIKMDKGKIILTVNVRYPIKSSAEEVYEGIRNNLKNTEWELIEDKSDMKPLYVSKDNFLVEKLMKVYREQTGDYDSQPITTGGGTYARAMDNAVAFGPMFPGQEDVAHQKNEYISIDHLMKLTKIYAQALYELAK